MIGGPGSGKTTYCNAMKETGKWSDKVFVIHKDDYPTLPQMLKALRKMLGELTWEGVVIDATHGTREQRRRSCEGVMKILKVDKVVGINLNIDKATCLMRNRLRATPIPDVAIHRWFSVWEPCDEFETITYMPSVTGSTISSAKVSTETLKTSLTPS